MAWRPVAEAWALLRENAAAKTRHVGPADPWRELAVNVLARAVRDVRSANGCAQEARAWLQGGQCADLVDALGWQAERLPKWLDTLEVSDEG